MNITNRYLMALLLCGISFTSCSQNNSGKTNLTTDIFAGSTPCDPIVNKMLNIPPSDLCAFMKWQLKIIRKNNKDTAYQLMISYGDYQPNSINFLNGGKSLSISGKLFTTSTIKNNTPYKILHLKGEQNEPDLLLIELDHNILHLIDSNMKLVKGNESHAFILNRIDTTGNN